MEDRSKASGRNVDLSMLVFLDQKIKKCGCSGLKFDCFLFCAFARKRNITKLASVSCPLSCCDARQGALGSVTSTHPF